VSLVWAISDPETRREIEEAHDAAVRAALSYLEEKAWVRLGQGGVRREEAGLVVATFRHGTARKVDDNLPDMDLHTHCLTLLTVTREGLSGAKDPERCVRTVDGLPFFVEKTTAGALYRAELAYQLKKRLGLSIERKKSWFEVAGVPEHVIRFFSKRRGQIEEALGSRWASAAAAALAAVKTRSTKDKPLYGKLFPYWEEEAEAQGFGPKLAAKLLHREGPGNEEKELEAALREALETVTRSQSYFSERDLLRNTAIAVQDRGVSVDAVRRFVQSELVNSPEIVRLGRKKGELQFALRSVLDMEREMLDAADRARGENRHVLSLRKMERAIEVTERRATAARRKVDPGAPAVEFTPDQRDALRHLLCGKDQISAVTGLPGTGKSTLLSAANTAWRKEGLHVIGGAVAGIAAEGLEKSSGISSYTVHRILKDLDRTFLDDLKHHVKQLLRAARGKKTYKLKRLRLSKKSVLVIDEAGMLSSKQLARLVFHAERRGARLVLTGDAAQLQSIEAGGGFDALAKRLEAKELTTITRQRHEWQRQAIKDLREGEASTALAAFAERGLLSVSETRDQAMRELISAWKKHGVSRPESTLIFTGTRYEAAVLNALAQEERRKAGLVGGRSLQAGNARVFRGDRILFLRNSSYYGVKNGTVAEVKRINEARGTLTARLDDGREVTVSLRHYGADNIGLGYSVTSHKGQGTTVDYAFVLAGGAMQDREISYVQASRARNETRIFTDRMEAGDDLTKLTRAMKRSRKKELAHTLLAENHHHHLEQEKHHEYRQRIAL
jgi:conjugative relaxase-like TrwC/TraI family protein